jgi:hypothetical protein
MSINENSVLSLGDNPPQLGNPTSIKEGYPIRGFFVRRIVSYTDKNNDHIITYNADPNLSEIVVSPDTTFQGYSAPRQFAALNLGMDLFRRKLRLTVLGDYRGGNKYYNNTERIGCVSRFNCPGLMDPNSSFEEQAMVVGTLNHPSQTLDGFVQPGAFIKLREVSAQWTLPERLARSVKSRSATLVVSARNVAKWTNYRGVDPENDFTSGSGGDNPSDFQTFGIPTYFVFRLNLGF